MITLIHKQLFWIKDTSQFLMRHLHVIIGLGLVAATGRVLQLGAFGAINSTTWIPAETFVEVSRLILFLYVLGMADVQPGLKRFWTIMKKKKSFPDFFMLLKNT